MERALWIFIWIFAFNVVQQNHLVQCAVPSLEQKSFDSEDGPSFDPRIVGGRKARLGDFRGIISLQTWKGEHMCGGTWIQVGNQSQILTAAHCVMNSKKQIYSRLLLQVMGDDLSISRTSSGSKRQIRKIRKIVAHPNYSPMNLKHDIAMVFLTSSFTVTDTFAPVQIANRSVVDFQACSIGGWGALEEGGKHSTELMMGNVSVVPRKICNSADSYNGAVGARAFCAGSMQGGTDSCQGDSGGGLMSYNTLVGIVSFGAGCGRPKFPGVYTHVYSYLNWITDTINASPSLSQSNLLILAAIAAVHIARSIF